jgi:hypothetical protein
MDMKDAALLGQGRWLIAEKLTRVGRRLMLLGKLLPDIDMADSWMADEIHAQASEQLAGLQLALDTLESMLRSRDMRLLGDSIDRLQGGKGRP